MNGVRRVSRTDRPRGKPWGRAALIVALVLVVCCAVPAGALAATNPHITSISPTRGIPGANVTINGWGFGATQGGALVYFLDKTNTAHSAGAAVTWSDTQIIVHVPNPAPNYGAGTVMVWQAGIPWSNETSFTTQNPALWISSLSPTHAAPGATVAINGWGFGALQGSSLVGLWGAPASGIAPPATWSSTKITFAVPAGMATGLHTLYVWVSGPITNLVSLSVDPKITSLSPTRAHPGATVTINGTGFGRTRSTSKVYVGSKAATSYVTWSDTRIKVKVPTVAAGSKPVKVKTKFGTTKTKAFRVL